MWRIPVNLLFFHVKRSDFRFVSWLMSVLKFGVARLLFEVFLTKPELFSAISVSSKENIESNDFELVLFRQTCQ